MNKYKKLSVDKLENHLNDYLLEYWSVSSLNAFRSNEKRFEKEYIYKDRNYISSVSACIGSIYHKVLEYFFKTLKEKKIELSEKKLCDYGFKELNKIKTDKIKVPKGKSIEDALDMILKGVNSTIGNFYAEKEIYISLIDEIVAVEEYIEDFIILNGKDIELPVRGVPDLIFRDKDKKLRILDHKTCGKYTDSKDVSMKYSIQSIIYMKLVEAKYSEKVHAFHFFENKISQNRDKSSQIKGITIILDNNAQAFYEAFVYEHVQKMINAVKDPNYIYMINPNDFFVDNQEMLEFWNKTRCGVIEFPNLTESQKKILSKKRLEESIEIPTDTILKILETKDNLLLLTNEQVMNLSIDKKIETALLYQNLRVKVKHIVEGNSADTYMLEVPPSTDIQKIFKHEMNIASLVGVPSVRIEKNLVEYKNNVYIAVEIPRKKRIYPKHTGSSSNANIILGVDNFGKTLYWDLNCHYTPHMLLSGASGSGKSYLLSNIINNLQGVEITVLDPKREFAVGITEQKEIEVFIENKVKEMEDIFKNGKKKTQLIIFDEVNDCIANQTKLRYLQEINPKYDDILSKRLGNDYNVEKYIYKNKDNNFKTLSENLMILAQKSRSAGIHLLLASQRFSVDVLKGDTQANFPVRLCLRVARDIDSKVMLGEKGAEKLLGNGDGLLQSPEYTGIKRIQVYK